MSVSLTSENVFLSALQPNNSSVSTYAVPSDIQLGHASSVSDELARARRVQQQVALRLAEKTSGTLPRQNGSVSQYASSDYGGSSTMKYQTFNPAFSSKSYVYSTTRPAMAVRGSQVSSGYSSRSAMDFGPRPKISYGGGGAAVMSHHDDMASRGYSGRQQVSTVTRSMSRSVSRDPETMSVHSMRLQQPVPVTSWIAQDESEGSLVSERDSTAARHAYGMGNGYVATATYPRQTSIVGSNGYVSSVAQGQQVMTLPVMRRSLSGTLSQGGGMAMGGAGMMEEAVQRQYSFKGPAHRTISRINQRQQQHRMSIGSASGGSVYAGGGGGGGFLVRGGSQGNLMRAVSHKSIQSVGRGRDVFDGMDMAGSMGNLSGINMLDMPNAVSHLETDDPDLQVLGAAYIQHECYHNNEAKKQVNMLKGIPRLVQLFTSNNEEVQRYATGAARNIIYENMDNKVALIEAGGIPQLMQALKEPDDELRKNVTGILWNLSSKDNLKEKLARETLGDLTDQILVPLSGLGDVELIEQSSSEADIFFNTTGCLRNLSSVNEKTRQQMRERAGLVDALVAYIKTCLEDTNSNSKVEEKGAENAVCVLRNLSYQLYSEIPPSAALRLEGPSRDQARGNEAIGCFTPQSKKAKERQNQDLSTFTEVAKEPRGMEWLWHPQVVRLYNRVLQRCEINSTTREAAAGALQNITAGDKRWASVLSRVAIEQERMLPVVLDHLRSTSDQELRSLTGFLRNLSRHARNKNDMATKVVNNLVSKLPVDGQQREPSSDVVVNMCGTLNNLVTSSELAARDITYFDGLPKLAGIKNCHDSSPGRLKAAKAAATVLCNMFQYKKLHKDYKKKGYTRQDFADMTI